MSYSQNNEEAIILNAINTNSGRFLDIGAHDGKWLSNTHRLAELGWSGVCVEASPFVFPKLVETYAGNPDIKLVNAAVTSGTDGDLVQWFDSHGDGVSTTSVAHKDKWEAGSKINFIPFWIGVVPLQTIFAKFGIRFTVISIDVESANLEIFNALPWEALKYETKVICIEHDSHVAEMEARAANFGFRKVAVNAENLILSAQ